MINIIWKFDRVSFKYISVRYRKFHCSRLEQVLNTPGSHLGSEFATEGAVTRGNFSLQLATQRRFKLPFTREIASCNASSLQNNPTAGHVWNIFFTQICVASCKKKLHRVTAPWLLACTSVFRGHAGMTPPPPPPSERQKMFCDEIHC